MLAIIYTQIALFCIAILSVIAYKLRRTYRVDATWSMFANTIIVVIALIALNLSWRLVDTQLMAINKTAFLFIILAFYLVSDITTYLWFIFSESLQESRLVATQQRRLLCGIPFLIIITLTVFSLRTGWLFSLDDQGLYQRGILFTAQFALSYGYTLFTSVSAFVRASYKKNFLNKGRFLALGFFGIIPPTTGILQTIFPQIPILCFGYTFAILLLFFDFQEELISTDGLTSLNNRTRMLKHLQHKMQSTDRAGRLFLYVLDVNKFKQINDRYGHLEGDHALSRVARILKQVAANNDCFLSRYGGDEFILISTFHTEEEARALLVEIREAFQIENEISDAPYSLTVSVGYAEQTENIEYIPDLIAAADHSLYESKRRLKELEK